MTLDNHIIEFEHLSLDWDAQGQVGTTGREDGTN
jgi:hypothetical protein